MDQSVSVLAHSPAAPGGLRNRDGPSIEMDQRLGASHCPYLDFGHWTTVRMLFRGIGTRLTSHLFLGSHEGLNNKPVLITAVIPTYSRIDLLCDALQSLADQSIGGLRAVVVDNHSPYDVAGSLRSRFPWVQVIRMSRNTFFAAAANRGAAEVTTPYMLVLNDDVTLDASWAESALAALESDDRIGSVASKLYRANARGLLSSAGDHMNVNGWAGNIGWNKPDDEAYNTVRDVFSASGACALYRASSFREVGGFDPDFVAYLEDVDLGFRLQLRGYRCLYTPRAIGKHVGGATDKRRLWALMLTERNMVWNVAKNMPSELLARHKSAILRAQVRPAPVVGGNDHRAWLLGKVNAIRGLPRILRARRNVQSNRRVSLDYIEQLLQSHALNECHL